jgi:hypothetical protein
MSEKVVLPKFDLPGQGPHPAVKALLVAGGLLGVSMLVLGGALWHQHSEQVAAEQAAKAQAEARTAEALATAEAAKAKAAEAAAKVAAAKSGSAVKPSVDAPKVAEADKPAVAANESHHKASSHHHGGSHATSKPGKSIAKGDVHASAKSTAASNKKKDDAIDKLLAQFK